jgi:hypothetical protein
MLDFNSLSDMVDSAEIFTIANPTLRVARTQKGMVYILQQYAPLAREIVSILTILRHRASYMDKWSEVTREMERNIAEELGSDSNGVSHYDILKDSLRRDLSVDIGSEVNDNLSTIRFLDWLKNVVKNCNSHFSLGVVYALELTATPELKVVLELATRLSEKPGCKISTDFSDFFERHIELWEPGHAAGLRLAVKKVIQNESEWSQFSEGFELTLERMSKWWQGMANECPTV